MRRKTSSVWVGPLGIGSDYPIRIQSMTTSNTRDAEATAEQCMKLKDAGCEMVRVTVQGIKEAETCEEIKNLLIKRGYDLPLVADIHFFPPAALRVVDFVEKVRINPGNFADKRASFKIIEYDEASYQEELERIEEKFFPLVDKCKKLKRALRIGTNHGSLSDRIMNRYGDTPAGMVESALEFARICRKYDYHNFLFSMKASNPQVMIQAYRLLVQKMDSLDWRYPLHLGVTEAGDGEEGRIKSAIGIGSLLIDGIGDTIRVSLTEDPWHEIDPCRRLIAMGAKPKGGMFPFSLERHVKISEPSRKMSMHKQGTVAVYVTDEEASSDTFFTDLGLDEKLGQVKLKKNAVDLVIAERLGHPKFSKLEEAGISVVKPLTVHEARLHEKTERFSAFPTPYVLLLDEFDDESILSLKPEIILLRASVFKARQYAEKLKKIPLILHFSSPLDKEDFLIEAAAELGSLLSDGIGDGVLLSGSLSLASRVSLSFTILQAARLRITKTDFISCPSCGRTLFDLQDVTKKIKELTAHLAGVKIAIMGCIVNGPGEMADADFGYVGSKPGKIDLYIGKNCIEKDIDFHKGPDRLVALIKAQGRWFEPQVGS